MSRTRRLREKPSKFLSVQMLQYDDWLQSIRIIRAELMRKIARYIEVYDDTDVVGVQGVVDYVDDLCAKAGVEIDRDIKDWAVRTYMSLPRRLINRSSSVIPNQLFLEDRPCLSCGDVWATPPHNIVWPFLEKNYDLETRFFYY